MSQRSFWGWGNEDYQLDKKAVEGYKQLLQAGLGIREFKEEKPPSIEQITIRAPRFELIKELREFCTDDKRERLAHSYGKAFRDVWRASKGIFDNPPDYIAFPSKESEIVSLFNFASEQKIAVIPYGGGSSVSGGIEPTHDTTYSGVITVDMRYFNKILEVDAKSRTARVQAGIFGPALEAGLKPHGFTLRHFPQSFEFSTLGGWIVTRAGGHFVTLYTHIDEFVQSVRVVTPKGVMQTRRLPGSGAGPSEERFISGSEGIFGIVTEAWVRLQEAPQFKLSQAVNFNSWDQAVECCRALSQSGLYPTNARLVDAMEAMSNGLGDGSNAVLILGFESANHEVQNHMDKALEICNNHQGSWIKKHTIVNNKRDKSADTWKQSFLRAPYIRDHFVRLGCIMETFETAITWDKFDVFHKGIMDTANHAIKEIAETGYITCRFTHLYPDGPAPYYTIIAKGQTGYELDQWDRMKTIISDRIIELGGTITHHHAVGKDHRPFYKKQSTPIFQSALKAVKHELDPQWILNPDVLIDAPKMDKYTPG